MRIDYKIKDKFDFFIFIPMFILFVLGLLAIYSSTINHPIASGNFQKQFFIGVLSFVIFFIAYFLPQRFFKMIATPSYIFSIIILLMVLIMGKTVYGAKSWISFGPIGFQPAEFAKVGLILFISKYLSDESFDINEPKSLAVVLLLALFPVLLILGQPDMGTSIVIVLIFLAIIFWKGISLFGLFVILSPAVSVFVSFINFYAFLFVLALIIGILFYFKKNIFTNITIFVINMASGFLFEFAIKFLSPHQQRRIESFLNPNADPLGSGYNALQAKVAIGSGGLFGKGFLEGNQTQLRFIPQQWTDFIFCVIGEEFGFIGSIITVILFLIIFIRLINIATVSKDNFSSLVTIGILSLLFIHFSINIGMNIGIMPVIGVPLPILSYGGSALMVNLFLLGIVSNFYRNRKEHT